jgi:hypothetical protein
VRKTSPRAQIGVFFIFQFFSSSGNNSTTLSRIDKPVRPNCARDLIPPLEDGSGTQWIAMAGSGQNTT